jgi:hypothetical protein
MIVFGGRLFGKVEQVPGLFHVATQFFHVNFVPLFPTKSWLVLHGSEKTGFGHNSWQGIELGSIRWGSVGVAWLRLGLFVALLTSGFGATVTLLGGGAERTTGMWMSALAVGCFAAFVASYRIVRANADSLRRLGADPNVPADLVRQAQAVLQGRKGSNALVR